MNRQALTLALALGAAVAHGEEKGPEGTWHVVEAAEDRGEAHRVFRNPEEQLTMSLFWPGTTKLVRLTGVAGGKDLDLQTELGAKGMVRGLRGGPAPDKLHLALRGAPLPPAEKGGPERLRVTFLEDGKTWRVQTWARSAKPDLEIVSLSPAGAWDPKKGPLKVRFRVLGEPQVVLLRVFLPGGTASGGPRGEFYAAQLGGPRKKELELKQLDLGSRAVGAHEVEMEGRDTTHARRILLPGEWTLRLESPAREGPPVERTFQIAPPRIAFVAPRWMRFDQFNHVKQVDIENPGMDNRSLGVTVGAGIERLGATPSAQLDDGDPAELVRALADSAMVIVHTHGWTGGVALYRSTPEERSAVPVPRQEDARVVHVVPAMLDSLVQAHGGDRPLRDLHTVVVYACQTGTNGAPPGQSSSPGAGSGLPTWLIRQGADIVVAFDMTVATGEDEHFFPRLLSDLSNRSKLRPSGGVRSIRWAAEEATLYADLSFWRNRLRQLLAFLEGGGGTLRGSLRLFEASGIDASRETFDPPRHGNSRN